MESETAKLYSAPALASNQIAPIGAYPPQQPTQNKPIVVNRPKEPWNAPLFAKYSLSEMLGTIDFGVYIKRKYDVYQVALGCEFENTYTVYQCTQDGESPVGPHLFKIKEESGYWCRQCCARAQMQTVQGPDD